MLNFGDWDSLFVYDVERPRGEGMTQDLDLSAGMDRAAEELDRASARGDNDPWEIARGRTN